MPKKYEPKQGWAAYQRERRAGKRKLGICVFCSIPALKDRPVCAYHFEYQKTYVNEWKRFHREMK